MSMPPPSQSPQPPDPYVGQVPPPQQPGVYGVPQGHPPQGRAPQGVPPQYPGPGGPGVWGQPPIGQWPPPPKKKRTGLVVGIALGALVVVGGLGYAALTLLDGIGVTGSFPEATHRLVVPKTLLDGEYKLVTDASATEGKEVEDTYDPSVKDARAAIAEYSGKENAVLVVSGFHGRLKDPEGTRDAILKGAVDKQSTLVVPPKDFTPAGHDGLVVTCQVTTSKDATGTATLPMCAWGDDNTASFVAVVTTESAVADPKTVDLAGIARTTAEVRAEMRKPVGG
ncbi:hypothetical protein [Streptomyces sp. NPDC093600]|uniref:hypothetical protein n=1 Tax=Streptomyces sp. NPDC093600 TaxID=3366047 RepID=UPI00381B4A0B